MPLETFFLQILKCGSQGVSKSFFERRMSREVISLTSLSCFPGCGRRHVFCSCLLVVWCHDNLIGLISHCHEGLLGFIKRLHIKCLLAWFLTLSKGPAMLDITKMKNNLFQLLIHWQLDCVLPVKEHTIQVYCLRTLNF